MTKASRDTQGGRKAKRGKKERKKDRQTDRQKERERERKGEEGKGKGRCSQLRTIVQGHTKEREGDPEYSIQENPRKQRKKGGGKGEEGGLSARQVPMNLKLALTPMVTLCPAKVAGCFDRCGHVKA